MTPAEEYVQKRIEAVALIETHAPQRLQQSLIDLLRPAIALNIEHCDDDSIAIGASKFGGAPDVAAGFEWPQWNDKPLGFLAQIDPEEITPFDVENLLPKSGMLSFFIEFDRESDVCSQTDEKESWRVFWFDGDLKRIKAEREVQWKVASVQAEAGWTFSMEVPANFDFSLEGEEEQWEDYLEIMPMGHRMFGYADEIGRPPSEDCETVHRGLKPWSPEAGELRKEIEKSALDWVLLFQLHSDEAFEMIWGDYGRLFFMIRPQGLAARDFSKTSFCLQNH